MSDFDKEAEREKLREKYERDREKRKETERMSQLLLQGATMTNRHCDTCGDPLFRYDGREFCATCEGRTQKNEKAQARAEPDAAAEATDTARDGASVDTAQDGATRTPAQTPNAADGAQTTNAADDEDGTGDEPVGDDGETAGTGPSRNVAGTTTPVSSRVEVPSANTGERKTRPETAVQAEGGDDLNAARGSLVRTLIHHARRAEAVDDPRRATDHLTAVREAAEALAALDRSR